MENKELYVALVKKLIGDAEKQIVKHVDEHEMILAEQTSYIKKGYDNILFYLEHPDYMHMFLNKEEA